MKDGEITLFKYNNGKYIATWTMAANGTTVTKGGWEVTEVTGN